MAGLFTSQLEVPHQSRIKEHYRFGGQRLCWNKQVRTDVLDAAVWDDVRRLLSEPERVRAEYEPELRTLRP